MLLGENITKRMVDQLLMDLRIATNPHLGEADQKSLVEELLSKRRALYGPNVSHAPLDKAALDLLKSQLKNSSKAIKVK